MKKTLKIWSLVLLSISLTACGSNKPGSPEVSKSQSTSHSFDTSSFSEEENNVSSTSLPPEESVASEIPNESESSSAIREPSVSSSSQALTTDSPKLTTSELAFEFLQKELDSELESKEDTEFIPFAEGSDDNGLYFDFKLTSKENRKNGGSGTIATYRVYEDRTYELYPY